MNIPTELKYLSSHEWVRLEGDTAVIGITDYAQDQLGDVTFVDFPAVGSKLEADNELGSIESVKAASELFSPVTGEIIEINTALEESPELVNSAPYTEGWLVKVKISGQSAKLLSADDYKKSVNE